MYKGLIFFFILIIVTPVHAGSDLLYLEMQAVGGYSSEREKFVTYSLDPDDVMQKPSIGFDYLKRLSTDTGDFGAFALQFRLAYNQDAEPTAEPQVYNAYFKYKAGFSDLWIGHNRPAMGLSSYFDSHGLLLPTLAMLGFGYDRDWGIGAYRDLDWGNVGFSLTTGSGMPLYLQGNYLASLRVSTGILSQDNYNLGFTALYGKTMDTMGYELVDRDLKKTLMGGVDFTHFWNNIENRFDILAGEKDNERAYALFWRISVNLLEEGRLKAEAQPVYLSSAGESNFQFYGGLSYQLLADLALRGMYVNDREAEDQRVIFQLYFYKKAF